MITPNTNSESSKKEPIYMKLYEEQKKKENELQILIEKYQFEKYQECTF
jgi:hypothetical protein